MSDFALVDTFFTFLRHTLFQVWPHSEYPLNAVGKFTLNRNPKNYHAEVEQAAYSPSNMVPGIEASPDKMLQVRNSISLHLSMDITVAEEVH